MDILCCTICFPEIRKDRGAMKCLIGFAIFMSIGSIILYFSLRTSEDDLCSEPRPITDFTALSWRHSPRQVKPCNTSDIELAEISMLEFYTVEVTGICHIECRGAKQFEATCPFYMQGINFVINGTNSTICGRVNLHLRWELNADGVTAKVIAIGNNPDTFMTQTQRECTKAKKNSTENENPIEVQLDQFSSILSQIYLLGVKRYLRGSHSDNSETVPLEAIEHSQNSTDHNQNSIDISPKYCLY